MKRSLQDSQTPLWRQRDFRLLLTGRMISETGTEVTKLVIPLTAALFLGATPLQMGLLTAAASLPALLIGLPVGALVDRLRRHRPVLVSCEFASAAALATVPFAWVAGLLTVPWLLIVEFILGCSVVIFRSANFPHIAVVVRQSQHTQAFGAFESAFAIGRIGGPGLAGLLVTIFAAPLVLVLDVVSFIISAFCIRAIRSPENHEPAPRQGLFAEVAVGLRAVATHPTLRALGGCGITVNLCAAIYMAVYILYVTGLGVPGWLVGVITAVSGAGGLLGGVIGPRLARRLGEDRALLGIVLLFPFCYLPVAVATGPLWLVATLLLTGALLAGTAVVSFMSCYTTILLRESAEEMRGRINATLAFCIQGVLVIGALLGGYLGEVLGLRSAIWVSTIGILVAIPWVWLSPLRVTRKGAAH